MNLFPQSTLDVRVYPFPPPAEGVDVRDYSFPQSTVDVRVYPFPPPAGCGREGVFISTVNSGR